MWVKSHFNKNQALEDIYLFFTALPLFMHTSQPSILSTCLYYNFSWMKIECLPYSDCKSYSSYWSTTV